MGSELTRRALLRAGLVVGVVASGGLMLWGEAPAPGLAVLSAAEVRIVEALAAALFPAGYFPLAGGDGGTAPVVDTMLDGAMDPTTGDGFRALLRTLELGTLVSRGQLFSSLPRETAHDVLQVWAREDPLPRRLANDTLRLVISMAFLRRPEVLRAVGWRQGCA